VLHRTLLQSPVAVDVAKHSTVPLLHLPVPVLKCFLLPVPVLKCFLLPVPVLEVLPAACARLEVLPAACARLEVLPAACARLEVLRAACIRGCLRVYPHPCPSLRSSFPPAPGPTVGAGSGAKVPRKGPCRGNPSGCCPVAGGLLALLPPPHCHWDGECGIWHPSPGAWHQFSGIWNLEACMVIWLGECSVCRWALKGACSVIGAGNAPQRPTQPCSHPAT